MNKIVKSLNVKKQQGMTEYHLTLKCLGGVKLTFNVILKHIFPENFIEFPQVVQTI